MRRYFALVSLCLLSLMSFAVAQPNATTAKTEEAPKNACSNLANPPTVGSCWDCFQSLLTDCDKANHSADRRKACYEGANNFFTWCLGRIPAAAHAIVTPRPSNNMIRGQGFSYNITFSIEVDPSNVDVYVRDQNNNEVRQQEVKSFVFKNADGSLSIFFDNNNLGLDDDKTIGIVTVVRNAATRNVDVAYAEVVNIIIPYDLNNDGVVDTFDYVEAWELYSRNEMTFEDFIEFLDKYSSQ